MSNNTQKTILLVEDEFLIAEAQKLFLEKYGYKVLTIETGEKAVEIFMNEKEIQLALIPESIKPPLEKSGYKVILVNTAEKAIEVFRNDNDNSIDIVLMDIDLGSGMDGTQAAEKILTIRNVPILFLSSHTEPSVVEKTEKITSYGYVVKNSSITVLDASIKMAFKLYNAHKKIEEELCERKKMDELLRASETRYRRLFETSKDGILILDAETGQILDVNPFLISLLGYTYENFLGKTIWDLGFLKDVIGNKEQYRKLQADNYLRYENLPLETFEGKRIEVEVVSNVYEGIHGKVIQCNIRDITERKEVEAGLEKTRKELAVIKQKADVASEFAENIINTVREPLLALDKDLRVVTVSRSFYEVFKVKPEDTVGQLIYDLGNKQWDIPKLRELLENILPQKTTFDNYEVEHDFASIGKRTMLLNARQIQQSAEKERIILLAIEDITERKEAEMKVDALLAEKEIILKEVHHRVKNSMNTLKSLLALQAETLTDPIAIEALKDTESRVGSMMVLYNKLYRSINYSRISIKDYLSSLIDEIIGNFPNSKIVKVVKNIDNIIIDTKRLQSIGIIINEVLTNTMKYAFIGRPEGLITVSAALVGTTVSIIIQDNGNSIPESINFENTSGFGLMLIRGLTEQLSGSIRIERKNGTSIILEFTI